MALAKREKILAWVVGGVGGLFLADMLILTPYLDHTKQLADMRAKDKQEADTQREQRYREAKLRSRVSSLPTDPKEAERQLLGAIKDWAVETGLTMSSVKPEYVEGKKDAQMHEILVQASGAGKNESMIRFLLRLQNAKFPLRILKMQLGTKTADNSEELTMNLRVSTLYRTEPKKDVKKDNPKKIADAR